MSALIASRSLTGTGYSIFPRIWSNGLDSMIDCCIRGAYRGHGPCVIVAGHLPFANGTREIDVDDRLDIFFDRLANRLARAQHQRHGFRQVTLATKRAQGLVDFEVLLARRDDIGKGSLLISIRYQGRGLTQRTAIARQRRIDLLLGVDTFGQRLRPCRAKFAQIV